MHGFEASLTFLSTHANLFVLAAITAMFADMIADKRNRRAARVVALISLCACAPLCVLYAVATALRPDLLSLALTALCGWNAWSAWHTWRRFRPWKPARPSKSADRHN